MHICNSSDECSMDLEHMKMDISPLYVIEEHHKTHN